jgi:DNA-binding SARP family transcriptional activator
MELGVLGPVGAWREGTEVALDGAKQRTVLAALVLARGRVVSAARLRELLWGEDPPATYPAQIHTYVSRLRKYLGPNVEIVRRWAGYLIELRDARLDLAEFERLTAAGRDALAARRPADAAGHLRAALGCWRGPALSNVTEYLADAQARAMTEQRLAALYDLTSVELSLGRHARLVPELTTVLADHPLHEGFRAHLVIALARCGRPADALSVYRDGCRLLADELRVGPGPALTGAHREVLLRRQGPGGASRLPAVLQPVSVLP